ncbi:MAG: DUF3179 domain-containing (seleno)protein [Saprospiraceae bacterium]
MKKYFYIGCIFIFLFEAASVFFILPIPGSQEMESIGIAYFLFRWKWVFRFAGIVLMFIGAKPAWEYSRILSIGALILLMGIMYMSTFRMKADRMFYEPEVMKMVGKEDNKVDENKLVLGVVHNGESAAYPINYLAYHHKIHDTIGGRPFMATYCSVCRTGRIYEPIVEGRKEAFRLVGMDHYNALFEDQTTKSWWRQESGVAVTGKLKGHALPEYPSVQTTLKEWLALYPNSLIFQPDSAFQEDYDSLADFESGMRKGRLERRDSASWQEKSWIAGIEIDDDAKAYDWNELVEKQIIHDMIGFHPIVLFLADDLTSVFSYERISPEQKFEIRNDTLFDGTTRYNLLGYPIGSHHEPLQHVQVSQEYWHSWKTFHPGTMKKE